MTPEEEAAAAAAAASGQTAQTTSAPAPSPADPRDPWSAAWADPRLQPFKDRMGAMQDRRREFMTGMQGARDQYRTDMDAWRQALPGNLGFAPRPGGTAGGGMAWDPSKINLQGLMRPRFQMPPGFAGMLPWGPRQGPAAAGNQTQPAAAPQGVAQGEPNPSAPTDTPAQAAAKQNMLQRGAGFFGAGAQSAHRPGATAPSQAQGQRWGNWGQNNAGAAEKINKMADANNAAHSAQKRDKAAWNGLGAGGSWRQ